MTCDKCPFLAACTLCGLSLQGHCEAVVSPKQSGEPYLLLWMMCPAFWECCGLGMGIFPENCSSQVKILSRQLSGLTAVLLRKYGGV